MRYPQEEAFDLVDREYREWVGKQIEAVAMQCLSDNGHWNNNTRQCTKCTEGYVRDGSRCLPPGSEVAESATAGACIVPTDFTQTWRERSGFAEEAAEVEIVAAYESERSALIEGLVRYHTLDYQLAQHNFVYTELQQLRHAPSLSSDSVTRIGMISKLSLPLEMLRPITQLYSTLVDGGVVNDEIAVSVASTSIDTSAFQPTSSAVSERVTGLGWGTPFGDFESTATGVTLATEHLQMVIPAAAQSSVSGDVLEFETEAILRQEIDTVLSRAAVARAQARLAVLAQRADNSERYNAMESALSDEYDRVVTEFKTTCAL